MRMNKVVAVTTPNDMKVVEDLAGTIWNESYRNIISRDQIDYMLEKFQSYAAIRDSISSGALYFILSYEGRNAGYFAVAPEGDRLFLSKIYVLFEYRRRGIASFAIGHLMRFCSTNRFKSMYLTVNRMNTGSIEFYRKNGFKIIEDRITDIGNGFVMDDYVMELRL